MLIDRSALYAVQGGRFLVIGEKLDGADAVLTDLTEEVEGRQRRRSLAAPDPLPDLARIREKIVEEGGHHIAAVHGLAQGD